MRSSWPRMDGRWIGDSLRFFSLSLYIFSLGLRCIASEITAVALQLYMASYRLDILSVDSHEHRNDSILFRNYQTKSTCSHLLPRHCQQCRHQLAGALSATPPPKLPPRLPLIPNCHNSNLNKPSHLHHTTPHHTCKPHPLNPNQPSK